MIAPGAQQRTIDAKRSMRGALQIEMISGFLGAMSHMRAKEDAPAVHQEVDRTKKTGRNSFAANDVNGGG